METAILWTHAVAGAIWIGACACFAIAVLGFYRIDRTVHQRNLERLRDAAALAETSDAEALEGVTPITRVI